MKRRILIAVVTVAAVAVILALWAFWLEPRSLVVRQERLELPKWPYGPLRIAVISDLHVGSPYHGVDKLEEIVTRCNDLRPDLVVLLGDFVIQGVRGGEFIPPETFAPVLGRFRSRLGTFAVLGNHDWWLDAPRVRRALESQRITILEDESVGLALGTDSFFLVGVSDFLEGAHDVNAALSQVPSNAPTIVITHNPDIFPAIPPNVSLMLAGHTHGGQVAVPLVGRPIVPSIYGERYAAGAIREKGKDLFVTTGTGTSIIPVRFRVPPEIVLLTIHHQKGGRPR